MRIAVMFNRFGPYHHARLRAAGRVGPVVGVEIVTRDHTYAWDIVQEADGFDRVTLFQEDEGGRPATVELAHRVDWALDRIGPDVVAIPGWSRKAALIAVDWCLRRGVPTVLMSDSAQADRPRTGWKERTKARLVGLFSAGLAGGSPHVAYLMRLGMPPERIFTRYDVVDNDHFARGAAAVRRDADAVRRRLSLPERYFLSVSRFVPQKNIPGLLAALASYRRRHGAAAWDLVLIGDGPERLRVEATIRELGLLGHVMLPGFRQYDELPAYYALAGAFVLASISEPWALVVNEAMAAGVPVLVSDRCGSASELVVDGHNGFVFDPGDSEALAARMMAIAADGCDREGMGRRGQARIGAWSPEAFGENLWRSAAVAASVPPPSPRLMDKALLWGLT